MQVTVHFLDTFSTIVAFGNHFHFYLCAFHGVAFTDHGTEHTVTAEIGVGCYEQVAQVSRIVDGTLYRMNGVQQTVHFLNGIRNKYCLEVVTVLQTIADTGCDSIDVLQYRCIFDTYDIRVYRCLDVVTGELLGENFCFVNVMPPLGTPLSNATIFTTCRSGMP